MVVECAEKDTDRGGTEMLSFESDYTEGAHEKFWNVWLRPTGKVCPATEMTHTAEALRKR